MPRSKSILGSKPSLTMPAKEQSVAGEVKKPDLNAAGGETALAEPRSEARAKPEAKVPTAKVAPEPSKLEVVKSDARRNLVPINLDEEIRKRAFELYQQRGAVAGNEAQDWLTAEREVRQRYRQQSA